MSSISQIEVPAVQVAGSHGVGNLTPRKLRDAWAGFALKRGLAQALPACAREYLDDGLEGDPKAAGALVIAAPNEYRGYVAVAAYCIGTPYEAYRKILSRAWLHDYGSVAQAAKDNRLSIRRMMKAARFPHPFTGQVKVYRGTSGIARWKAQQGMSWTIDPDVAAWFAFRYASDDRKPLVLTASADASDIIFYDNDRSEQEVILSRPVLAAVEGNPASLVCR